MITQEPELEVVWSGDLWRSYPRPPVAVEQVRTHLADEVRAYLSARPGKWCVLKEIAAVLHCSHDELTNRLRGFVARGDIESGWVEKWGARRWCYRWVEKPETPRAPRRVRPTAAEYQAMRARLLGDA